jgi:AcrR family transcriptional regulator
MEQGLMCAVVSMPRLEYVRVIDRIQKQRRSHVRFRTTSLHVSANPKDTGDGVGQDCTEDRRVRRTKTALRHAMVSLIHDKPFAAIAVKEIIARADVGRSAFYAHFHSKDDLLTSAVRETLRASARAGQGTTSAERLLRFSRPLVDHIARASLPVGRSHSDEARDALHARVRDVLVEHLLLDLRRLGYDSKSGANPDDAVPSQLLAEHISDSFLRVIHWWSREKPRPSAADADRIFRALVLPAVQAAVRDD